jgi:hypothetical protein
MSSNTWDEAKQILGVVAPALGTALGGPLGGIAARTLATVLLGKTGASDAEISNAITTASPDQLLAIKKAEIDFQQRMRELDVDLEKISAADRDSARKMQMQTNSVIVPILSMTIVCSWVFIQYYLLTHTIEIEMREIIMRTLGTLDAALGLVLSFFFGSSASSKMKDETIKSIVSDK